MVLSATGFDKTRGTWRTTPRTELHHVSAWRPTLHAPLEHNQTPRLWPWPFPSGRTRTKLRLAKRIQLGFSLCLKGCPNNRGKKPLWTGSPTAMTLVSTGSTTVGSGKRLSRGNADASCKRGRHQLGGRGVHVKFKHRNEGHVSTRSQCWPQSVEWYTPKSVAKTQVPSFNARQSLAG